MRFLHTSDWHLGRTIRGLSRLAEFEAALGEVTGIAKDEGVDAVLIAGDIFDTSSPPPEAERLLYDTLGDLLGHGIKVAMIAGNHDHARRMDALAAILRMAGIHSIGQVPADDAYAPLRLPSRDGSEAATIVALPWVPESMAVEYEQMFGTVEGALVRYAGRMERAIAFFTRSFARDTANIFLGHLMIDGVAIGEGSGERKLHIGQAFAVPARALPSTAQYIALGHVHRPQEIAGGAPAYYSGSLLQLDFGEAGQQKSVNIIEASAGRPAEIRCVPLASGRALRDVRVALADLPAQGGKHGDDYLRVFVELERPEPALYEKVRDVLPNALDVKAALPASGAQPVTSAADHRTASPEELFSRYYRERYAVNIAPDLLALFSELYRSEVERATT